MAFLLRRAWIKSLDVDRIRRAIADAEKLTSGEIRVSVSRFFWGKIPPAAERAFGRMKMKKTGQRNGVLFFIVPARRKFVVLGDEGIHAKVGQEFWDRLAAAMSGQFRKGEFTEGIIEGIGEAGLGLASHFPYDSATDKNELSDEVDVG